MNIKGVIFDLDGVLVNTIPLHYAAWKRMFEEYGYTFNEQIYRQKVDGKPRLDGVLGVMKGINDEAVIEAGNRKQEYFLEMIVNDGVDPFPTTIPFLKALKKRGIALAVASSSVNAPAILEGLGVLDDFKAVVTAEDVVQGKPHPDIFLAAAKRLDLSAQECIVFEDAESGIEAARRGDFFCVGVDRNQHPEYFMKANLVVADLGDIDYMMLDRQFQLSI